MNKNTDVKPAADGDKSALNNFVSRDETDWSQMLKIVAGKFDEIAELAATAKEYNMAQRFGNSADNIRKAAKVIDNLHDEADEKERNKAKQNAIKTAEAQRI